MTETTPPPTLPLVEPLARLLDTLEARNRHVIVARFGLDGGRPRTLEAIGADLALTRERVRQIERNLLAALATLLSPETLDTLVEEASRDAWNLLSREEGYLRRADLIFRRHLLPPGFELLLALARLPVPVWLDRFYQRLGAGWCERTISAARLRSLAQDITPRLAELRGAAIADVGAGFDLAEVRLALALVMDRPIRNGRVAPGRPRSRRQSTLTGRSAVGRSAPRG